MKPERFAQFAENVMGISSGESAEETAIAGIEALENFFRDSICPQTSVNLGCEPTDAQIAELAE